VCGNRRREAVQQGCLTCLRAARDDHVQPTGDRGFEKPGGLGGDRAKGDEFVERMRCQNELTNVDGPVPPGDVGNHHMEATAVRKHRVDERRREIDPASRSLEHLLAQVTHLRAAEDGVRELASAELRDEHATRLVDPDFLNRRIVKITLQGPEPGNGVEYSARCTTRINQGRQRAAQRALVVVGDDLLD
jgi:hypothetical protein